MEYFTFDSIPSTDFGVYVVSSNMFDSAEEDVESVEIPYSNNVVHLSKGNFKPFPIKVECAVFDSAPTNLAAFRNFLQSRGKACRYVDSLNPDEFRIARFKKAFEVSKTDYVGAAAFGLEFEARPERFIVDGETAVAFSSGGTITNDYLFAARPLIKVNGLGTCYIGDYEITLGGGSIAPQGFDHAYIDCESMQCYYIRSLPGVGPITYNANSLVEMPQGFPVLGPGDTYIDIDTVTSVEITPRWWKL